MDVVVLELLDLFEHAQELGVVDVLFDLFLFGAEDQAVDGHFEGLGHFLEDIDGGGAPFALVAGEMGGVHPDHLGEVPLCEAFLFAELFEVLAEGHIWSFSTIRTSRTTPNIAKVMTMSVHSVENFCAKWSSKVTRNYKFVTRNGQKRIFHMETKKPYPKRKSKVQEYYRERRWGGGVVDPQLRLRGRWLMEAGFAPGTETEIEVRDGELVIKKKEGEDGDR